MNQQIILKSYIIMKILNIMLDFSNENAKIFLIKLKINIDNSFYILLYN